VSQGQVLEVRVRKEDKGQLVQLVLMVSHYWQVIEHWEQVLVAVRW
jgi:hypothetical protein